MSADSLYGGDLLADLPEGSTVYLVESPSEVAALRAGDLPAVCVSSRQPDGALLPSYTEQLRPFNVVVIPSAGYPSSNPALARARAGALRGKVKSVKLTPPPPPGPGGGGQDVGSFLLRNTLDDLIKWAAEVAPVDLPHRNGGAPSPSEDFLAQELGDGMEIPPAPVPPMEYLPRWCRELLSALARGENPLPLDFLYGNLLAVVGIAAGAGPRIRLALTWTERLLLWFVGVGPSGLGKSPALNVLAGPLYRVQSHRAQQWWKDYEAWLNLPKKDRESTAPPVYVPLLSSDTTLEKLARNLAADPGHGIVVDEIAGFLGGLGQYKGGGSSDRARLLELGTGAPWGLERVSLGPVPTWIREPTVIIVGTTTRERLSVLADAEDGLSARFGIAYVPRDGGDAGASVEPLAVENLARFEALLTRLIAVRKVQREWLLDGDARALLQQHRSEAHGRASATDVPPHLRPYLSKAGRWTARYALVHAELHRAAALPDDAPGLAAPGTVTLRMAEAGIATFEYYVQHRHRLELPDPDLTISPPVRYQGDVTHRLLAALAEDPAGRLTVRDLLRRHVAGCRTSPGARDAIAWFGARYPGWTRTEPSRRGRPALAIYDPLRPMPPLPPGAED